MYSGKIKKEIESLIVFEKKPTFSLKTFCAALIYEYIIHRIPD